MKICYNPCNPHVLIALLGILIFCSPGVVTAQCQGDFSFQSFPADSPSLGKIEISTKNISAGTYTFKVYALERKLILVDMREVSSPEKITFENLKPSTYFVKVEWGGSCYKTLGGFEGIIITEKDQGK